MDKHISEDELSKNDGQDSRPAYVAYKGTVYDVSGSRLWASGLHQRRHKAGQDLTAEFTAAPHDESVFQRVPVVGQFGRGERIVLHPILKFYLNLHPHPIAIHFPIALILVAAAFLILYFLTGVKGLVDSAYYSFLAGVIMSPIAIVTGIISWWFNYGRKRSKIFIGKASLSAVLLVLGVVSATLWTMNRNALVDGEGVGWIYFSLVLLMSSLVIALGKLGGDLVFPSKQKNLYH
jgi:predicted heme/steroid binding protein/uncharacterized membrane protein